MIGRKGAPGSLVPCTSTALSIEVCTHTSPHQPEPGTGRSRLVVRSSNETLAERPHGTREAFATPDACEPPKLVGAVVMPIGYGPLNWLQELPFGERRCSRSQERLHALDVSVQTSKYKGGGIVGDGVTSRVATTTSTWPRAMSDRVLAAWRLNGEVKSTAPYRSEMYWPQENRSAN